MEHLESRLTAADVTLAEGICAALLTIWVAEVALKLY
jgi:hypothetical protein